MCSAKTYIGIVTLFYYAKIYPEGDEMGAMTLISVKIPRVYLEAIEYLVKVKKLYPNRSEAIRVAIRDLIMREAREVVKTQPEENYLRTVVKLFNEEKRESGQQ